MPILLDVLLGDHNDIYGQGNAVQIAVDFASKGAPMDWPLDDDKQVYIAVRFHLISGCRAKQDDTLGMGNGYDALDDFFNEVG